MKRFIILLFAVFSINAANAQDWQMLNSGTTKTLRSCFFKNADTGFVVGDSGTILKTFNGGKTWNFNSYVTGIDLYTVFFPDANTGYIGGYGSIILKTNDGGMTWTVKPTGYSGSVHSIYFIDAERGFAVGGAGILKTSNGGNTWNQTPPPGNGQYPEFVFFSDSLTGYITGSCWGEFSLVLKTIDGGINWNNQSVSVGCPLHSIFFTSKDTGIIVGGYYIGCWLILKTTNGGVNWNTISFGYMGDGYSSVFFIGKNKGYIAGESGVILRSSNGGTTWQHLYSGTTRTLFSIYFPDSLTGYAVGDSGTILKTINGGGVGINEGPFAPELVRTYPNPTKDQITIETFSLTGNSQFSISTVDGRVLMKREIKDYKTQIDVSFLPAGIYFMRFKNEKTVEIGKIIKE